MAKYISNRQKNLKVGISSYSENLTSLEVIGKVGIGTTNPASNLHVIGNTLVVGVLTATTFRGDGSQLVGVSTISGVSISTNTINQSQFIPYVTGTGSTAGLGVTTRLVYNPSTNSLGIGTTNPTSNLHVIGDVNISGIVSATSYFGSGGNLEDIIGAKIDGITVIEENTPLSGTYSILRFVGDSVTATGIGSTATITITSAGIATFATSAGIATNLKGGDTGDIPYQSAANTTAFVDASLASSGQVLLWNGSVPSWGNVSAAAGAFGGISVRDEGTPVGTASSISTLDFRGTNIVVTATTGANGIATVTIANNLVGTSLSISGISTLGVTSTTNLTSQQLNVSGISTLGTLRVSSGIVTATTGIITYFGDGSGLTGTGSTVFIDNSTDQTFFPLFTNITTGTITASGISTSKLTYNPFNGEMTAINFNSTSDINLKENIKTVENSLDTLIQLRGVSFDWKETGFGSYGVIAQELEEVLPELVKNGEIKSVNYNGIIGVLIEAIKELKKEVEELKSTK